MSSLEALGSRELGRPKGLLPPGNRASPSLKTSLKTMQGIPGVPENQIAPPGLRRIRQRFGGPDGRVQAYSPNPRVIAPRRREETGRAEDRSAHLDRGVGPG